MDSPNQKCVLPACNWLGDVPYHVIIPRAEFATELIANCIWQLRDSGSRIRLLDGFRFFLKWASQMDSISLCSLKIRRLAHLGLQSPSGSPFQGPRKACVAFIGRSTRSEGSLQMRGSPFPAGRYCESWRSRRLQLPKAKGSLGSLSAFVSKLRNPQNLGGKPGDPVRLRRLVAFS